MLILSILILIVSILLIIYSKHSLQNVHKINQEVDNYNQSLEKLKQELQANLESLENNLKIKNEQLDNIQSTILFSTKAKEELSQKAFENYCEILDKQYKDAEDEYNTYTETLGNAYANIQSQLMQETASIKEDLDKIKATRAAAIQALTREKEIEEKISFYCLQVSDNELKDISVLEAVKPKLNNSRILSMLIWQTYWRTPMTNLCNNVIGKETKTGIYKITNQKTKECYIGQAVDLAFRWKSHAKCGLGIDMPAGNKLYKAMQEFGIQNFSWEIIEECPKEELDSKEKYYIELYQSKEFGYNSTKGNS